MAATSEVLGVGLIGAGRMGSFHAESVAHRLVDARLVAIADHNPEAAATLAGRLGADRTYADAGDLIADADVAAVIIAAPARAHADLVAQAAAAGKGVFCEKPMAVTLAEADRAIAAASASRVVLQVGFQRRFARDFVAAREVIDGGGIGQVQLMRSLTRDPGLAHPERVPPWTIFLETLIHDFDVLHFLNPGARPVEVFAFADALVAPDYKSSGLLDTAVVSVRFDNGALATAEASFSAAYGYDVRAEAFGSAGMVTMGDLRSHPMARYTAEGERRRTVRADTTLFADAYTAELSAFVEAVREGSAPLVSGADARAALSVALAAVESYTQGSPVTIDAAGEPV